MAENTAWDEQIGPKEGPEIHLDAVDNDLSISRLVSDKLTLKSEDRMTSSAIDPKDEPLTEQQLAGFTDEQKKNPKGYIEVKDKGGFNMDTEEGYGDDGRDNYDPDGFDYKNHHDTETGDTTTNDDGTEVKHYTDHSHDIEFENKGDQPGDGDFMFRYDKEFTEDCEPLPDTGREDVDSLIDRQRIPREVREVSKNSKVSDNTVDQTASVMAAAAKVNVSDTEQRKEEKDNEDE